MGEWIRVEDRLPDAVEADVDGDVVFSDFVLAYFVFNDGYCGVHIDKCNVAQRKWLFEIPEEGVKITHWMPLPEPPKEEETC